mmetsp:Transcript_41464/g.95322  ORF Transcript_41464/g.95322 Transcript_41464/m.95322 type:complete len:127 (+) Transcript_41464:65-445(+)
MFRTSLLRRCPHQVLGVPRTASFADTRAAYLRLARVLHPDRNTASDAAERFRQLQKAWQVLKGRETMKQKIKATPEEAAERRAKTARLKEEAKATGREPNDGFVVVSMVFMGLLAGAYALISEMRP